MPKPYFQILIDEKDITSRLAGGNISLTINDRVGLKSDSVDIEIDDANGIIAPPRTGVSLRVVAGYEGDDRDFGTFIVDEVTLEGWPQRIGISAQSADALSGLKERRSKSFQPPDFKTYGDLFADIAERDGLTLSMSTDLKNKALEYEAQSEEEDSSFLTRLGEKLNAAVSIKSGHLVAVTRGAGETASGKELPQILVRPGLNIISYNVSRQNKAKHRTATARWFDRKRSRRSKVSKQATNAGPDYIIRYPHQSESDASSAAESEAHKLKRSTARATFLIDGNPQARAEAYVLVQGVRSLVDGVWRATSVSHHWSADGSYATSLQCELPNG